MKRLNFLFLASLLLAACGKEASNDSKKEGSSTDLNSEMKNSGPHPASASAGPPSVGWDRGFQSVSDSISSDTNRFKHEEKMAEADRNYREKMDAKRESRRQQQVFLDLVPVVGMLSLVRGTMEECPPASSTDQLQKETEAIYQQAKKNSSP